MTLSRADTLALRRRLLVLDASIQRLRLQRDIGNLAAAANPAALIRERWRQLQARPALVIAALATLLIVRRAGAQRLSVQALNLWRAWQALRGLFSGPA